MKTIRVSVRSMAPMLMHNGQLSDPLNEYTRRLKAISSKRKKTDEDHYEMAKIEWYGGLYIHDGRVVIPTRLIEACILNGAAKDKNKTLFKPAFMIEDEFVILDYTGPKNIDKLYEEGNNKFTVSCGVQSSRVMRTRPVFYDWGLTFDIMFDESLIDDHIVRQAIDKAGRLCGLGDWRPKFGRFEVTKVEEV